jgi:hypothetical protein
MARPKKEQKERLNDSLFGRGMTLKQYKKWKLQRLKELLGDGYKIGEEVFADATSEIQVDNIARRIIFVR